MFQTPSNQIALFFLAIVGAFVALISFLLWYFGSILNGGVGKALDLKKPSRPKQKDNEDPPVI